LSILAVYEVLACDPGWFFFLFVFQILEGTLKVSWLASLKIEGVEGEGRVKRKKKLTICSFYSHFCDSQK